MTENVFLRVLRTGLLTCFFPLFVLIDIGILCVYAIGLGIAAFNWIFSGTWGPISPPRWSTSENVRRIRAIWVRPANSLGDDRSS